MIEQYEERGTPLAGLRILQVNKLYWPDIGGVETVVRQYAHFAAKAGAEVTVLCSHPAAGRDREEVKDGSVHVIRHASYGTRASLPLSPGVVSDFVRLRNRYDIVHFHEPHPIGTLLGLVPLRRYRSVLTWHSDIERQRYARPILMPLQRRLCKAVDIVTTTSQRLADHSAVLRTCTPRARILPLSIDLNQWQALAAQSKQLAGLDLPARYFLYMGRLASYKGLDVLLRAAAKIELGDAKLVIAGDGPERSLLDDIPESLRGSVIRMTRRLSEEEKACLIAHCEFLVFPSTFPNEAFGIVQLEAMSLGKPVINTGLPTGVPWVSVGGKTGLTVPPGDCEALAAAISALLRDPDLVRELGQMAVRRAGEMFSDSVVAPSIVRLYSDLARTLRPADELLECAARK